MWQPYWILRYFSILNLKRSKIPKRVVGRGLTAFENQPIGEQHSGTLSGLTPRLIQAQTQAFFQKQQIMAGMAMMSSYNSFASPMYSLWNVHQFNGQNWETAQSAVVPEMRNCLIDTIIM